MDEQRELMIEYEKAYNKKFNPILQNILTIVKNSGGLLEGNCFYTHNSTNLYPELKTKQVNLIWAGSQGTKICEIGFNAGHSAFLFLATKGFNHSGEFVVFDIMSHAYTRPCYDFLKSLYPSVKWSLFEGDSMKTLPSFTQTHPEQLASFDVVHVDGGHTAEIARNDIQYALKLVRPGGLIIVDDTNDGAINNVATSLLINSSLCTEVEILGTVGYKHRIFKLRGGQDLA